MVGAQHWFAGTMGHQRKVHNHQSPRSLRGTELPPLALGPQPGCGPPTRPRHP